MEQFNWDSCQSELDRIFFKDFQLISRHTQDHKDFWNFFRRYLRFQSRQAGASSSSKGHKSSEHVEGTTSVLSLPLTYDKSYRINFSVVTEDLSYRLRRVQEGREDTGRKKSELTMEHLTYFRTALRHFVNFQQKQKFERLVKIRTDQCNLPIFQFKRHIIESVRHQQVIIVAGDTGCGKSTQVPQYLLGAGFGKVACTQPRRIACISLAKRVSYETLNEYGTEIAYQVRFERSRTPATKVLFLTEGLLLRQLTSDPDLSWYNVLIVDEVHERHMTGDFLLGLLRLLVDRRQDLKLILMSATINITLFSSYFQDAPVIRVPGRLYPIELQYHPIGGDYAQLSQKSQRFDPQPYIRILQMIDKKYPATERGDMLIFLSGMTDIAALLQETRAYAQKTGHWIVLPLHSALSVEEQDRVFDVAPDEVRKCIISTNIAETSITIDGIRFVVDSGKVKEMSFDHSTKMSQLQEFWISRASSEQRKGRAGRTGPGVCYRIYAESDYDSFAEYSTPEIQRVPLESLVLQTAALHLGNVRKFPFIEPPSLSSIEVSVSFLKEQGAMREDETLTSIGEMLAKLPVDVVIGKMLVMGTLFDVIEPVLIVAAGLSVQSPFSRTMFDREDSQIQTMRRSLESEHGDPFTLLNAFDEWIEVKSEGKQTSSRWCRSRGVEQQRFYEMVKLRQQFREVLMDHHLMATPSSDTRTRGWDKLSMDQQQQLREMRKRQRTENRRRKILRADEDGGALNDGGDDESVGADLKHLEFKLLHDIAQLQAASSQRRQFTLRDLNLLKVVVCSGLYPQLAITDECNSSRKGSEQVFHTKSKDFVVLHPTSVLSTNPDYLHPAPGEKKRKPELLAFEKLLETNKPYLVNVLRVPALQVLGLFSQNIDTNGDCSRLVADGWLELKFTSAEAGQAVLSDIQTLRSTWSLLLEKKLSLYHNSEDREIDEEVIGLERLLGTKLAEFLDADYPYTMSQLSSTVRSNLYRGVDNTESSDQVTESSAQDTESSARDTESSARDTESSAQDTESSAQDSESSQQTVPAPKIAGDVETLPTHPVKGGKQITEYLTFDCLVDSSAAEASSSMSQHLRRVWSCPTCHTSMPVTVAEQLQHQSTCAIQEAKSLKPSSVEEPPSAAAVKEYYCQECKETFNLSSIDILKHKRKHKRSQK